MANKKYFYALYDDDDKLIDVFENMEEAIFKNWKISKENRKEFHKLKQNIFNSIKFNYWFEGYWYKYYSKDKNNCSRKAKEKNEF